LFALRNVSADLGLAVLCVELVDTVQLSVTIVHDATRPLLTILKRVFGSEVVAKLMCKNAPCLIDNCRNTTAPAGDQLIHP
jgi:hypothetical protein